MVPGHINMILNQNPQWAGNFNNKILIKLNFARRNFRKVYQPFRLKKLKIKTSYLLSITLAQNGSQL